MTCTGGRLARFSEVESRSSVPRDVRRYDGAAGKIKITFHPTGIASIGEALAVPQETTT